MDQAQIEQLATSLRAELVETHISWVLLTHELAFKLKKPIRLPFLDFSALADRKLFCERELALNRRLAPQVYLEVVPVEQEGKLLSFGEGNGRIIDYAVKMKRLESGLQMDRLMEADQVQAAQMEKLAKVLAAFHRQADIIDHGETAGQLIPLFNDLRSEEPDIELLLGRAWHERVELMIESADAFLAAHEPLFYNRIRRGFIRDCHGDLHCGNIFLYEEPVVFDCIEFKDEFRQIDVLHELAFLCMDLEVRGRKDLAEVFLQAWTAAFAPPEDFFHEKLFAFYKCYMANVRAKVTAMRRGNGDDEKLGQTVLAYLQLMEKYLEEIVS